MVLRRALAAALAALTLALIAPASASVVLNRGNTGGEPTSLDPHFTQGTWENFIVGDMLMGLTTEDRDAKIVPGAAESWTISPDGLVWTFKMRAGAVWSDGQPVTADDFVFSWRRILDPQTAAQYASMLYLVKNAEAVNGGKKTLDQLGVRALDPMTFEVTLERPAPFFYQITAHQATFPVPKHVVERLGREWIKQGNYVSNGPFKLGEWRPKDYVRLEKNPLFYDAANVKVDTVYWRPTEDSAAALKRFRAGELDMNDNFPVGEFPRLKQDMPDAIRMAPYLVVSYLIFNHTREPFNDVRVRKALSLAFDRVTLTEKIYGLGEPAAYSLVPPGTDNYAGGPKLADVSFPDAAARMAEARRLMAEVGFGANGKTCKFRFNIGNDNDARRAGVMAQQMWRDLGCDVELQSNEGKVHYNAILQTNDFDVATAGWVGDYNDAETFLFMFETNNQGFNYGLWSNAEYDRLMAASRQEPDIVKRADMLKQAEAILLADYAIAPSRYPYARHIVAPYVQGFVINIRDVNRTRWLSIDPGQKAPSADGSSGGAEASAEGRPWYWWLTAAWNWFLGLLCSWFGVACPAG